MEERTFHVMMRELCSEMGISLKKLSYGWILQLEKDGKVRHITGNRFDINPEAGGDIACDKYATYEVLKSQNVPVVEHTMLFNPTMRSRYIEDNGISLTLVSEFLKHGCLVIKPNNGCEGIGVSLCHTLREAEIAVHKLFKTHGSISLCPYYNIKTEYRTFYLDGKVHLIYGKTKPYVTGDGKSNMGELIEALNLPDKSVVQDNLNNIDLTYVPSSGERVNVSWKHNLSGGAKPTVLDKSELYTQIEQLAIKAGAAMNMNFATIDVIQTENDELFVLEVNSGVCATIFVELVDGGYEKIKNIYKNALEKMFE
ncbi:MAG: hypothetical protein J6C46_01000 [Clostridia bacterium]|nr:hypothetical protein [Clostridia bacterium]